MEEAKVSVVIEASSESATEKIKRTTDALKELRSETARPVGNPYYKLDGKYVDAAGITSKLRQVDAEIERTQKKLAELSDLRVGFERVRGNAIKSGFSPDVADAKIKELTAQINEYSDALEALQQRRGAIAETLNAGPVANSAEELARLKEEARGANKALSASSKAAKEASAGIREVGKAAKTTKGPLQNFIASLKRIAFYRFIRSIIKTITQALTEGLQAAYKFSAGMTGSGHRFAEAMDSMKSATAQMKAQLGAAFIALLTAIQPVLEALINIVIRVADAMSQLFSAFTGNTYLKANRSAAQYADTMERGAGAAKEWKNQLLGFDEINRLNEPSGGGGGGGAASDLAGFDLEPAEIEQKWLKLAQELKGVFDGIKEAASGMWDMVAGIFGNDWERVFKGASKVVSAMTGTVCSLLDFVGIRAGSLIKFIQERGDGLIEYLEEKFGLDLRELKDGWDDFCRGIYFVIKNLVNDIKLELIGWKDFLTGVFTGDWDLAWQGLKEIASGAIDAIKTMLDLFVIDTFGVFDWFAKSIDNLAQTFAFLFGGGAAYLFGHQQSSPAKASVGGAIIKHRASGGHPETGELFIAREAGPELVGTMNGQSTVANNADIVAGIRQGVFEAVSAAMSNNSGNSEAVVRVYLDGREIRTSQQRTARAMGV